MKKFQRKTVLSWGLTKYNVLPKPTHHFLESFQVLRQQIFSRQLVEPRKVVNFYMLRKVNVVKLFMHPHCFSPEKVNLFFILFSTVDPARPVSHYTGYDIVKICRISNHGSNGSRFSNCLTLVHPWNKKVIKSCTFNVSIKTLWQRKL